MVEWLTITELAEHTNIPETTIRRYIKHFSDFFITKGGSRSKRYEEQGVKILIRIKNLYDGGRDTDEISEILTTEFSMVIDDNKMEVSKDIATLPTGQDLDEIRQSLKCLEEKAQRQEEFNKALLDKLEQQQQYIEGSLSKRDTLLMENIRTMQEQKQLFIEEAATKPTEKKWWEFWK